MDGPCRGWWRSESGDFRASGKGRALTRRTYRKRTYLVILEVESADCAVTAQKLLEGWPEGSITRDQSRSLGEWPELSRRRISKQ